MSLAQLTPANNYWSLKTIKLRAAAARTKGDPVVVSTGHTTGVPTDANLADDTNVYVIAVPIEDAASGDVYEAAIEGGPISITVPSGNYTAGNGFRIFNGLASDSGSAAGTPYAAVTANDLGIIVTGGTSVTTITVLLYGLAKTATT